MSGTRPHPGLMHGSHAYDSLATGPVHVPARNYHTLAMLHGAHGECSHEPHELPTACRLPQMLISTRLLALPPPTLSSCDTRCLFKLATILLN